MDFITTGEVLERWVGDDLPDTDKLAIKTADANELVEYKFPSLASRIGSGAIPHNVVRSVLAVVVQRALDSDGVDPRSSFSFTSGPFSESGSYSGANAERAGTLFFTKEEARTLSGGVTSNAFMVGLDNSPYRPRKATDLYADGLVGYREYQSRWR